jgi:hypothetical protein
VSIPLGLCQCGCGGSTNLAPGTDSRRGWVKGQPVRFIIGHRAKLYPEGKRYREARGASGRSYQHIAVVEAAIGKPLPAGALVHHVNGNQRDNRPENLVACQDRAYHALLHQRQRALVACGNASFRKCKYCKRYDDPANLRGLGKAKAGYHRACQLDKNRKCGGHKFEARKAA